MDNKKSPPKVYCAKVLEDLKKVKNIDKEVKEIKPHKPNY